MTFPRTRIDVLSRVPLAPPVPMVQTIVCHWLCQCVGSQRRIPKCSPQPEFDIRYLLACHWLRQCAVRGTSLRLCEGRGIVRICSMHARTAGQAGSGTHTWLPNTQRPFHRALRDASTCELISPHLFMRASQSHHTGTGDSAASGTPARTLPVWHLFSTTRTAHSRTGSFVSKSRRGVAGDVSGMQHSVARQTATLPG